MDQQNMFKTEAETPPSPADNGNGTTLGFEEKLWTAADKMRGHMDPSEYKNIILGLVFLKYISDVFQQYCGNGQMRTSIERGVSNTSLTHHIFWIPKDARWPILQVTTRHLAESLDQAMDLIERENPPLKGVLPKIYTRSHIDEFRLRQLVDLVGTVDLGSEEARSQDIIGRVYEYFLLKFAGVEGNKGGEFYTPRSVVRLLVEMIQPFKGTVYDPCCGTAGMFIQSEKFIKEHGGKSTDIKLFGQESNPTTWRLAQMNLACKGLKGNLGEQHADAFLNDLHPGLTADYILANPPFNMSYWGAEKLKGDPRWKYGEPPSSNANFAWVQHIVAHLNQDGVAGFVLANGSLSSNGGGENKIREALIKADLIDCIVALPNQLFYGTSIPASLWFIRRTKERRLKGRMLFIDARGLGTQVDRTHKQLRPDAINRIANTYRTWRENSTTNYEDVGGFCKSASQEEIETHKWALVPGRYVGFDETLYKTIDTATVLNEIKEAEERIERMSGTSYTAIIHLRHLLHGKTLS